ncbi:MAG: YbjN domain-containing protein [Anaerolineae bacterium]|nr:YbjN domain-containing protein [Anaerolineae bacterium]MDW8172816.1 YbjN domain-containing protein [Anaerolineae bacterium]
MGLLGRGPKPDTLAPYARHVEKFLRQMQIEPSQARQQSNDYIWRFVYGSALIEIALFHKRAEYGGGDYMQIYSPLLHLPASGLLPLYRRLLELNLSMSQAAFGVRDDVIYLFLERSLLDLEFRELETLIKMIADNADRYDNELMTEFNARPYHHP